MTRLLDIIVPGVPIAQPRHRIAQVGGHVRKYLPPGPGGRGPHPVVAYKTMIGYAAAAARAPAVRGELEAGPVAVKVLMVFPRPQSKRKKRGPNAAYPHASKPDIENCAKAILDALTAVIWRDDSQVYDLTLRKMVEGDGESPRTEIIVDQYV